MPVKTSETSASRRSLSWCRHCPTVGAPAVVPRHAQLRLGPASSCWQAGSRQGSAGRRLHARTTIAHVGSNRTSTFATAPSLSAGRERLRQRTTVAQPQRVSTLVGHVMSTMHRFTCAPSNFRLAAEDAAARNARLCSPPPSACAGRVRAGAEPRETRWRAAPPRIRQHRR